MGRNMFRSTKHRVWLRLITFIVITTLVCQNAVWASPNLGRDFIKDKSQLEEKLAAKSLFEWVKVHSKDSEQKKVRTEMLDSLLREDRTREYVFNERNKGKFPPFVLRKMKGVDEGFFKIPEGRRFQYDGNKATITAFISGHTVTLTFFKDPDLIEVDSGIGLADKDLATARIRGYWVQLLAVVEGESRGRDRDNAAGLTRGEFIFILLLGAIVASFVIYQIVSGFLKVAERKRKIKEERRKEDARIPSYSESEEVPLVKRIADLDPDELAKEAIFFFGRNDEYKELLSRLGPEPESASEDQLRLFRFLKYYTKREASNVIRKALGLKYFPEGFSRAVYKKSIEILRSQESKSIQDRMRETEDKREKLELYLSAFENIWVAFSKYKREGEIRRDDLETIWKMHALEGFLRGIPRAKELRARDLFNLSLSILKHLQETCLDSYDLFISPESYIDVIERGWDHFIFKTRGRFSFRGKEVYVIQRLRDIGIRLNAQGLVTDTFSDEPEHVYHDEIVDIARNLFDAVYGIKRYDSGKVSEDVWVQREFNREMTLMAIRAREENDDLKNLSAWVSYYELGTVLHELGHKILNDQKVEYDNEEMICDLISLAYSEPHICADGDAFNMMKRDKSMYSMFAAITGKADVLILDSPPRYVSFADRFDVLKRFRKMSREEIQLRARELLRSKAPVIYQAFESEEGKRFIEETLKSLKEKNATDIKEIGQLQLLPSKSRLADTDQSDLPGFGVIAVAAALWGLFETQEGEDSTRREFLSFGLLSEEKDSSAGGRSIPSAKKTERGYSSVGMMLIIVIFTVLLVNQLYGLAILGTLILLTVHFELYKRLSFVRGVTLAVALALAGCTGFVRPTKTETAEPAKQEIKWRMDRAKEARGLNVFGDVFIYEEFRHQNEEGYDTNDKRHKQVLAPMVNAFTIEVTERRRVSEEVFRQLQDLRIIPGDVRYREFVKDSLSYGQKRAFDDLLEFMLDVAYWDTLDLLGKVDHLIGVDMKRDSVLVTVDDGQTERLVLAVNNDLLQKGLDSRVEGISPDSLRLVLALNHQARHFWDYREISEDIRALEEKHRRGEITDKKYKKRSKRLQSRLNRLKRGQRFVKYEKRIYYYQRRLLQKINLMIIDGKIPIDSEREIELQDLVRRKYLVYTFIWRHVDDYRDELGGAVADYVINREGYKYDEDMFLALDSYMQKRMGVPGHTIEYKYVALGAGGYYVRVKYRVGGGEEALLSIPRNELERYLVSEEKSIKDRDKRAEVLPIPRSSCTYGNSARRVGYTITGIPEGAPLGDYDYVICRLEYDVPTSLSDLDNLEELIIQIEDSEPGRLEVIFSSNVSIPRTEKLDGGPQTIRIPVSRMETHWGSRLHIRFWLDKSIDLDLPHRPLKIGEIKVIPKKSPEDDAGRGDGDASNGMLLPVLIGMLSGRSRYGGSDVGVGNKPAGELEKADEERFAYLDIKRIFVSFIAAVTAVLLMNSSYGLAIVGTLVLLIIHFELYRRLSFVRDIQPDDTAAAVGVDESRMITLYSVRSDSDEVNSKLKLARRLYKKGYVVGEGEDSTYISPTDKLLKLWEKERKKKKSSVFVGGCMVKLERLEAEGSWYMKSISDPATGEKEDYMFGTYLVPKGEEPKAPPAAGRGRAAPPKAPQTKSLITKALGQLDYPTAKGIVEFVQAEGGTVTEEEVVKIVGYMNSVRKKARRPLIVLYTEEEAREMRKADAKRAEEVEKRRAAEARRKAKKKVKKKKAKKKKAAKSKAKRKKPIAKIAPEGIKKVSFNQIIEKYINLLREDKDLSRIKEALSDEMEKFGIWEVGETGGSLSTNPIAGSNKNLCFGHLPGGKMIVKFEWDDLVGLLVRFDRQEKSLKKDLLYDVSPYTEYDKSKTQNINAQKIGAKLPLGKARLNKVIKKYADLLNKKPMEEVKEEIREYIKLFGSWRHTVPVATFAPTPVKNNVLHIQSIPKGTYDISFEWVDFIGVVLVFSKGGDRGEDLMFDINGYKHYNPKAKSLNRIPAPKLEKRKRIAISCLEKVVEKYIGYLKAEKSMNETKKLVLKHIEMFACRELELDKTTFSVYPFSKKNRLSFDGLRPGLYHISLEWRKSNGLVVVLKDRDTDAELQVFDISCCKDFDVTGKKKIHLFAEGILETPESPSTAPAKPGKKKAKGPGKKAPRREEGIIKDIDKIEFNRVIKKYTNLLREDKTLGQIKGALSGEMRKFGVWEVEETGRCLRVKPIAGVDKKLRFDDLPGGKMFVRFEWDGVLGLLVRFGREKNNAKDDILYDVSPYAEYDKAETKDIQAQKISVKLPLGKARLNRVVKKYADLLNKKPMEEVKEEIWEYIRLFDSWEHTVPVATFAPSPVRNNILHIQSIPKGTYDISFEWVDLVGVVLVFSKGGDRGKDLMYDIKGYKHYKPKAKRFKRIHAPKLGERRRVPIRCLRQVVLKYAGYLNKRMPLRKMYGLLALDIKKFGVREIELEAKSFTLTFAKDKHLHFEDITPEKYYMALRWHKDYGLVVMLNAKDNDREFIVYDPSPCEGLVLSSKKKKRLRADIITEKVRDLPELVFKTSRIPLNKVTRILDPYLDLTEDIPHPEFVGFRLKTIHPKRGYINDHLLTKIMTEAMKDEADQEIIAHRMPDGRLRFRMMTTRHSVRRTSTKVCRRAKLAQRLYKKGYVVGAGQDSAYIRPTDKLIDLWEESRKKQLPCIYVEGYMVQLERLGESWELGHIVDCKTGEEEFYINGVYQRTEMDDEKVKRNIFNMIMVRYANLVKEGKTAAQTWEVLSADIEGFGYWKLEEEISNGVFMTTPIYGSYNRLVFNGIFPNKGFIRLKWDNIVGLIVVFGSQEEDDAEDLAYDVSAYVEEYDEEATHANANRPAAFKIGKVGEEDNMKRARLNKVIKRYADLLNSERFLDKVKEKMEEDLRLLGSWKKTFKSRGFTTTPVTNNMYEFQNLPIGTYEIGLEWVEDYGAAIVFHRVYEDERSSSKEDEQKDLMADLSCYKGYDKSLRGGRSTKRISPKWYCERRKLVLVYLKELIKKYAFLLKLLEDYAAYLQDERGLYAPLADDIERFGRRAITLDTKSFTITLAENNSLTFLGLSPGEYYISVYWHEKYGLLVELKPQDESDKSLKTRIYDVSPCVSLSFSGETKNIKNPYIVTEKIIGKQIRPLSSFISRDEALDLLKSDDIDWNLQEFIGHVNGIVKERKVSLLEVFRSLDLADELQKVYCKVFFDNRGDDNKIARRFGVTVHKLNVLREKLGLVDPLVMFPPEPPSAQEEAAAEIDRDQALAILKSEDIDWNLQKFHDRVAPSLGRERIPLVELFTRLDLVRELKKKYVELYVEELGIYSRIAERLGITEKVHTTLRGFIGIVDPKITKTIKKRGVGHMAILEKGRINKGTIARFQDLYCVVYSDAVLALDGKIYIQFPDAKETIKPYAVRDVLEELYVYDKLHKRWVLIKGLVEIPEEEEEEEEEEEGPTEPTYPILYREETRLKGPDGKEYILVGPRNRDPEKVDEVPLKPDTRLVLQPVAGGDTKRLTVQEAVEEGWKVLTSKWIKISDYIAGETGGLEEEFLTAV